jgi:concanavalin A-like lectin/glucanase superfamily protein
MTYVNEVLADSPIAYWRLGSGSSDVTDFVGSHTLTKTGAPVEFAGLLKSDPNDKSRDFPGAGTDRYDYSGASLADFDFTGTNVFSIEAWVNIDTIDTNFRRIIGHEDATNGWTLQYQSAAGFAFTREAGGSTHSQSESVGGSQNIQLAAGITFHLVGTYDGTNDRLYVNKTLTGPNASSGSWTAAVTNSVRTGPFTGTSYADGRIDEIAVYNTVLSAARVGAHYDAGILSPDTVNTVPILGRGAIW